MSDKLTLLEYSRVKKVKEIWDEPDNMTYGEIRRKYQLNRAQMLAVCSVHPHDNTLAETIAKKWDDLKEGMKSAEIISLLT